MFFIYLHERHMKLLTEIQDFFLLAQHTVMMRGRAFLNTKEKIQCIFMSEGYYKISTFNNNEARRNQSS